MPDKLQIAIQKYKVHSIEKMSFGAGYMDDITLAGGAPQIQLSFDMQPQIQSLWCWAATSVSVSIFYDNMSEWTQCLVAEEAFSSGCCQSPMPCDKLWYLHEALTITNNLDHYEERLTHSDVERELQAGRVIGCRVGWRGGGGHFMVLHGCKTVNNSTYFSIDDPIYGKSEITETAFLDSYQGSGSWTHSFITKP